MVFPGRFSTGCLRCRQRKVKCDETKPSCRRCYIYGKVCLGYTDQFQFRYKSANTKPGERPSCPTRIKSTVPMHEQGTTSPGQVRYRRAGSDDQVEQYQLRHQAILRHPEVSYDQVSLCYFVRRFVSPDEADGFPGHLSFLPDLFDHDKHGLLETATLSVAQMAAYNQFGGDKFRLQSYRNHGRSIRMLQDAIQREDQVTDDKVITAILLLCTHKDISGEGSGDPNEHAPGLFYLVEKRGPGQIGTKRGAELFHLALLRLQTFSFIHGDDRYSDPGAIATVMGLFDPLLRAMSMMSRTLSLRHALSRYMNLKAQRMQCGDASKTPRDSATQDQGQAILKECFETLDNFHNWDAEAVEHWQSTFEGRPVPTALGEIASGKTRHDAETACIIILVRSARLILLLSILQYHSEMQLADDGEDDTLGDSEMWAECVQGLKEHVGKTIEDILSSVPYALGDTDTGGVPRSTPHDGAGAIVIVHSIRLVAYCVYATSEQLEKARSILARMNAMIGIRSAVEWVDEQSIESG
ncbi:hypothetical protein B0J13DRAFT_482093 [Dactylonectria estremocensis]|uniref:Zn(2)-C6 fungal-type domain-containing protein n=1 Tax=Dactylonectria estremocensis TaxID=1079267 RepID=A0A9P9E086_9HYPO|nr:hypothetical protein B0J13DRAFT_482093 [Dactylonectria estremocensis]